MKRKRNNKKILKKGDSFIISKEQQFNVNKPRYNGFNFGHGVHGDTKYNRLKEKRKWNNEMENE